MTGSRYEMRIEGMAYGGSGFGRLLDGRIAFVPGCMVGELVSFNAQKTKRDHIIGGAPVVLDPSPERIEPKCVHFGDCGGCHYQHIPYHKQLIIKQSILADQLRRIGDIDSPLIAAFKVSPLEWYYRNQVDFRVAENGKLGFYQSGSHRVTPIEECHIIDHDLDWLRQTMDLPSDQQLDTVSMRKGVKRCSIRYRSQSGTVSMIAITDAGDRRLPTPQTSDVIPSNGAQNIRIIDTTLVVSDGSFFQVNIPQAENLVRYLLESVVVTHHDLVLDVYSGVGLFSRFLAPLAGRCLAIENSPSACQDFATNLNDLDNVSLYQGDTAQILGMLDEKPDIVIVDPPRAGLTQLAMTELMKLHSSTLVYVSCDAATLARDVRGIIASGYELISVQPFDMFPQTYHIETVCIFARE